MASNRGRTVEGHVHLRSQVSRVEELPSHILEVFGFLHTAVRPLVHLAYADRDLRSEARRGVGCQGRTAASGGSQCESSARDMSRARLRTRRIRGGAHGEAGGRSDLLRRRRDASHCERLRHLPDIPTSVGTRMHHTDR